MKDGRKSRQLFCKGFLLWFSDFSLGLELSRSSSPGNPALLQHLSNIIDQTKETPAVTAFTKPSMWLPAPHSLPRAQSCSLTLSSSRQLQPPCSFSMNLFQLIICVQFLKNCFFGGDFFVHSDIFPPPSNLGLIVLLTGTPPCGQEARDQTTSATFTG